MVFTWVLPLCFHYHSWHPLCITQWDTVAKALRHDLVQKTVAGALGFDLSIRHTHALHLPHSLHPSNRLAHMGRQHNFWAWPGKDVWFPSIKRTFVTVPVRLCVIPFPTLRHGFGDREVRNELRCNDKNNSNVDETDKVFWKRGNSDPKVTLHYFALSP